jgi:hypothetical protein
MNTKSLAMMALASAAILIAACSKIPQKGDEFLGRWASDEGIKALVLDISKHDDTFIVKAKNDGGLLDGTFRATYDNGKLNPHNTLGEIAYDKKSDSLDWAGSHLTRQGGDEG